jgi:phosphate transport system substrate-binding protein
VTPTTSPPSASASAERSPSRAALLSSLGLSVALGLSACSASNESASGDSVGTTGSGKSGAPLSGTLNGAGSSAQEAAMAAWKAGFQSSNPGATVNYDAVGSGSGREQFISGGVDFAGSDSYLSDDELTASRKRCGADPVEIPVYVSPIAIVYNLPSVVTLQLSPQTVAKIFAGKITRWDDPTIRAENPDATMPSTAVTPVHRSDDSGTTANFTDYLANVAPGDWTHPADDTWPTDGGEAADGTSGVVSAVTQGDGTIGYADASQADDLGQALVKVGSSYVAPITRAASAVLAESTPVTGRASTDMAMDVNRTTVKAGVYPIVLISYQITCATYDSKGKADLVKAFESYVISRAGQRAAAQQAGSAPITDALRQQAQQAIDSMSATK